MSRHKHQTWIADQTLSSPKTQNCLTGKTLCLYVTRYNSTISVNIFHNFIGDNLTLNALYIVIQIAIKPLRKSTQFNPNMMQHHKKKVYIELSKIEYGCCSYLIRCGVGRQSWLVPCTWQIIYHHQSTLFDTW